MAEEERIWRQRHNHELGTLTYGTYGAATYQQQEQSWTFLKEEQNSQDDTGHLDIATEEIAAILELSSNPETVLPAQNGLPESNAAHHRRLPLLAATAGLADVATRSSSSSYATQAWSQRIAIGSAVWLGVDGVDSGNLSIHVVAYTTGNNDKLRVACVGRTNLESTTTSGNEFVASVPSFSVQDTTDWQGIEQIQQILFSSKRAGSRSDTYLAVRLQSQTCLFEPLLRRDTAVSSASSKGSLDLNRFLTLPVSATGDHTHADVAFDPHNHRRLAIIDVEGNWSIWTVHGKRVRSARVLHQTRLRASVRAEVDGHGLQAAELPTIAQMILQYEDLSIVSINMVVQPLASLPASADQNYHLRLPPTRGLQHRSERFIDEIDDDDNGLTDFVVADDEVVGGYALDTLHAESPAIVASGGHRPVVKDISATCTELVVSKSGFNAGSRHNVSTVLSLLHERLHDGQFLDESSQAFLLSELTVDGMRVENIDSDSAALERSTRMLVDGLGDKLQIEVCRGDLGLSLVVQYEKLFDHLVKSLPSIVPDRPRVQRERLVREIALDQLLASQTIRKVVENLSKAFPESQPIPAMDSLVLSDPIQQDDLVRRSISETSASQPQPQLHKHEDKEPGNATASPLLEVINRLGVYTELQKAPPPVVLEDDTTSSQIMSLLAHLSNDAEANPDNYDWQAVELALAVEMSGGPTDRTTAKDRASERLARARRRAERTASNVKNTDSTSVLPESSHAPPPVRSSGLLPSASGTIRTRARISNTQPAFVFSDGVEQAGSSGQANPDTSVFTSTQPVSGAFGSRSAVNEKAKARKKKRVAGF
ncbi:hypothetical protein LTR64_006484 [Lithohypha guttulata]|uniref:uncharacterized protein n=1 Tax=Lithohypha guttulata TaxID=1690604 RepID=UPI002DDE4213|nr:hypothetical protein LTR51_004958 [Lithohypha guttulata]